MKKLLCVGNCGFDGPEIKRILENNFDVEVLNIGTIDESLKKMKNEKFDLIIVNRICATDNTPGIKLIDHIKKNKIRIPIMMITNYKDKMDEALKHGAVPGCGKEDIFNFNKKALEIFKRYLK